MTYTLDDARFAALDAAIAEDHAEGLGDAINGTDPQQPNSCIYLQGYIQGLRILIGEQQSQILTAIESEF